jgi:hypothetical protein
MLDRAEHFFNGHAQHRLVDHSQNEDAFEDLAEGLPEANSERFESIEAKLDELRSYPYANRESVRGYAEAYRKGERISTAHVESTVNQLINWRNGRIAAKLASS